ncbi:MAG: cyclase family protein [Henriciella sp.]
MPDTAQDVSQKAAASETAYITEAATGLNYYELSHPWGHHTPIHPGFKDTIMYRAVMIAENGVMSQRIKMTMHGTTHVNAPLHLISGAAGIGEVALDRFFGSGPVISIKKARWELITAVDLEQSGVEVGKGDIVILNTGWHHGYSDSQEYFGHAPGMAVDAAEWLVDKQVKMVGVDTPNIDHPMATLLGEHRKGPHMRRLPKYYRDETGKDPKQEFPDFAPAHKTLLRAGIPTIENVGGALDALNGQRSTFHAMPWKWPEGDACVIRLVAFQDPNQTYRI